MHGLCAALTAVEPESSNQLRSTAEPWLAPGVCAAHRSGDKPFYSMEKDKTDVHHRSLLPPQSQDAVTLWLCLKPAKILQNILVLLSALQEAFLDS